MKRKDSLRYENFIDQEIPMIKAPVIVDPLLIPVWDMLEVSIGGRKGSADFRRFIIECPDCDEEEEK